MKQQCRNEWCDNYLTDTDEEDGACQPCETERQKTAAYYARLYRAEKHYTREDIIDSLSDPTERNKQSILIERLGL